MLHAALISTNSAFFPAYPGNGLIAVRYCLPFAAYRTMLKTNPFTSNPLMSLIARLAAHRALTAIPTVFHRRHLSADTAAFLTLIRHRFPLMIRMFQVTYLTFTILPIMLSMNGVTPFTFAAAPLMTVKQTGKFHHTPSQF
jgi:hypothetical protein